MIFPSVHFTIFKCIKIKIVYMYKIHYFFLQIQILSFKLLIQKRVQNICSCKRIESVHFLFLSF